MSGPNPVFVWTLLLVAAGAGGVYLADRMVLAPGRAIERQLAERDAQIRALTERNQALEAAVLPMLDRGVDFVRERTEAGKRVLIHCQHGIGRAPLLALCVLVDQGWAPLDALNHPEGKTGDVAPCLSRDGGFLFFASDRPGGKGGLDLWVISTLELNKKR